MTTAVVAGSFSVAGEETVPEGVAFNATGTRMYVVGDVSNKVWQYDLTTAWDVTTAVVAGSFSVAGEETVPEGVAFNATGTRMYVVGDVSNKVWQYDLTTAWDVTTAVVAGFFRVAEEETSPRDVAFNATGTRMYVVGIASGSVWQYTIPL